MDFASATAIDYTWHAKMSSLTNIQTQQRIQHSVDQTPFFAQKYQNKLAMDKSFVA